jgi:hypothetical protein
VQYFAAPRKNFFRFLATLSGSSDASSPARDEIIELPDAGDVYSVAIS